jgi:hypothetical protein
LFNQRTIKDFPFACTQAQATTVVNDEQRDLLDLRKVFLATVSYLFSNNVQAVLLTPREPLSAFSHYFPSLGSSKLINLTHPQLGQWPFGHFFFLFPIFGFDFFGSKFSVLCPALVILHRNVDASDAVIVVCSGRCRGQRHDGCKDLLYDSKPHDILVGWRSKRSSRFRSICDFRRCSEISANSVPATF